MTDWVLEGLRAHLAPGDWAVDATLGNGRDALVLARCVGPRGRVWGFDIQRAPPGPPLRRLAELPWFRAVHADHAELARHLPPEAEGRLRAVVFNLGYLPGGDPAVATGTASTLPALEAAFAWLAPDGVLACTCYPGRPESRDEAEAVAAWFTALSPSLCQVTRIERIGTREACPRVWWAERFARR